MANRHGCLVAQLKGLRLQCGLVIGSAPCHRLASCPVLAFRRRGYRFK
jgi:hypothetical protein